MFLLFLFFLFFFSSLVLSRVCVMFTSLNLKPVFSLKGGLTLWHRAVTEQRLFFVFIPSVNWIKDGEKKRWHPRKQVKGWKKCNVYCCTIFSNKRTQNLFVLFLCEHPLIISPPLFYCYLLFFCCWCFESGSSCNSPTSIRFTFLASLLSIYIHPSTLFLRHQTFSVTYSFFVSLWRLCCPNMDTNVGDYFDGEVLRGWTSTRLCSRANRTLSSLCYNFVRNVYIFFLCIT